MANPIMQALMNGPMNQIMNSPVVQLANAVRSGNPQAVFQQMIGQNPQMKQVADSMQGQSPQQMSDYMRNMAQQKGVDLGQLASQLGMPENVAQQLGIKLQNG